MRLTGRVFTPIFLLYLANLQCGFSATLTVGQGGGSDYPTLTAAIGNAATDDVLLVDPGIYDVTRGEVFPLAPTASVTIRASSGEASPAVIGNGTDSVFRFEDIRMATVDGIEIRGGGNSGIDIDSTTTTILNLTITKNEAGWGGGIHARQSNLVIKGSKILENRAENQGGGVYLSMGNLDIVDCDISKNEAWNNGEGGGIRLFRCLRFLLRNTMLSENYASDVGIAISSSGLDDREEGSVTTIADCTITNHFSARPGFPSVVDLNQYRTRITNTKVFNNGLGQMFSPSAAVTTRSRGPVEIHTSEIRDNTGMRGIHVGSFGTLDLEDCIISRNGGDGVISRSLRMIRSIVSENGQSGISAGAFQISDSEISDNFGSGIRPTGGAPFSEETVSEAINTLISRNGAVFYVDPQTNIFYTGGVELQVESCFRNCQFIDNRGGNFGAGGLFTNEDLTLEECTFRNNTCQAGVAAIYVNGGEAIISRCQIIGNKVDDDTPTFGHVIEVSPGAKVSLINSILSGNSSLIGSPFSVGGPNGSLSFLNCTIEANIRTLSPFRRPLISGSQDSILRFVNTIVWNGPESIAHINPIIIHSNFEGGIHPGPGNISEDPLFFQPWDGTSADYRLPCNSPSVDSGTSEGAPSVDITGGHRPRGAEHDMGAYENCVLDFNGDGMESGEDLLFFPTEWYEEVTVDNKVFDFVTGPSTPNRIDALDLLEVMGMGEER